MEPEPAKEQPQNDMLGKIDDCGERAEYHNLVDILFVLDATGSMSWCMDQMKKTVCKIMKKFSDNQYNIKFAIELYRDHEPQEFTYVEKHFDLRNLDATIKIIDDECDVGGGGDFPEAVFDGLVNGLKKTSWRMGTDGKTRSKRFLFHGCDAPPHGKQYGSTSSSDQWTKNGCPCGLTRFDVKKLLDDHNVSYSLIKCGDQVETMATLFKQCFSDKFRREMEIKKSTARKAAKKAAKSGRVLERKRSVEYMEQIQMEEKEQCFDDYGSEQEEEVVHQRYTDARISQRSRSRSRQRARKPQKKKLKKNKKKEKAVSESSSSSDSEGNRSMASLVLSDIEDGIQDMKKQA